MTGILAGSSTISEAVPGFRQEVDATWRAMAITTDWPSTNRARGARSTTWYGTSCSGLHLFSPELTRKAIAYYLSKHNKFGMALDNRRDYTKLDWPVWTATLSDNDSDFQKLICACISMGERDSDQGAVDGLVRHRHGQAAGIPGTIGGRRHLHQDARRSADVEEVRKPLGKHGTPGGLSVLPGEPILIKVEHALEVQLHHDVDGSRFRNGAPVERDGRSVEPAPRGEHIKVPCFGFRDEARIEQVCGGERIPHDIPRLPASSERRDIDCPDLRDRDR